MTNHWAREAISDDKVVIPVEQQRGFRGHGHDRIHGNHIVAGVSSTVAMPGDSEVVDMKITAGQKMLSAMSGSLLTSLLGKLLGIFFDLLSSL